MPAKPTTVAEYLSSLPDDRRKELERVRAVVRRNLPKGYEEGMQYGMIGYYVPHSIYPPGYHCDPKQPLPFAALAARKNYISLGLMCTYQDAEHQAWFRDAWARSGKKLDMGKACVRIRNVDDAPLDVIGEAVRRVPPEKFIRQYESLLGTWHTKRSKSTTKESGAIKGGAKKPAAKQAAQQGKRRNPPRKPARKK